MAKKNPKRKATSRSSKKITRKVLEFKDRAINATSEIKSQFNQQKFTLVLRSLFLFIILFILSLLLYSLTSGSLWNNFFFLFVMIFGFVSLAFLIVFLIFVFYKLLKK